MFLYWTPVGLRFGSMHISRPCLGTWVPIKCEQMSTVWAESRLEYSPSKTRPIGLYLVRVTFVGVRRNPDANWAYCIASTGPDQVMSLN